MFDFQNKKILLFASRYQSEIVSELKRLEASVFFVGNNGGMLEVSDHIKYRYEHVKMSLNELNFSIEGYGFDVLFVIKGDTLNVDFLNNFIHQYPNASRVIYFWDTFFYYSELLKIVPYFQYRFSFDSVDCENYKDLNLIFRPLFFAPIFDMPNNTLNFEYDLGTVGVVHPKRLILIKNIDRLYPFLKKNYFLLSYNTHIRFFLIMLKYRMLVKWEYISLNKPLEIDRAVELLKKCVCILDSNTYNQSGLTMRTIESIGLGRKLITTNTYVKHYDFYHPNNILVVDENNPLGVLDFLRIPYEPVSSSLKYKYSLSGWISEIFDYIN